MFKNCRLSCICAPLVKKEKQLPEEKEDAIFEVDPNAFPPFLHKD
jgi:hypothetical protein